MDCRRAEGTKHHPTTGYSRIDREANASVSIPCNVDRRCTVECPLSTFSRVTVGTELRNPLRSRLVVRGGASPSTVFYRLLPSSTVKSLPEEPNHRAPRAIRHFRFLSRAQEAVPDAGIDRVPVVRPIAPHRRVHVGQAGVDARVLLGVDAEAPRADARDGRRVGARTITDDEGAQRRVARRVAEALAPAPAETDDADPIAPRRLERLDVRHGRVEVQGQRVGIEPADEAPRF